MSCGYCSVDLANLTKSEKIELTLLGGSPNAPTTIKNTDILTSRGTIGGKIGKFFGGKIKSTLLVQITAQDKIKPIEVEKTELLPRTIILPLNCLNIYRAFRGYQGKTLYTSGRAKPNYSGDITIQAFLKMINLEPLLTGFSDIWNTLIEKNLLKVEKGKNIYNYTLMKEYLEKSMATINSIFDSDQFHFNKTDQTLEYYNDPIKKDARDIIMMQILNQVRVHRLGSTSKGQPVAMGKTNEIRLSYNQPFSTENLIEDDLGFDASAIL